MGPARGEHLRGMNCRLVSAPTPWGGGQTPLTWQMGCHGPRVEAAECIGDACKLSQMDKIQSAARMGLIFASFLIFGVLRSSLIFVAEGWSPLKPSKCLRAIGMSPESQALVTGQKYGTNFYC